LPSTGSSNGTHTATLLILTGLVMIAFGFRRRLQPES
jgi:LPXTG-motif cell wall-anchored protein